MDNLVFLDMNVLVLDVLHSKSLKPFGRVEIHDIVELNGTNPIDKYDSVDKFTYFALHSYDVRQNLTSYDNSNVFM